MSDKVVEVQFRKTRDEQIEESIRRALEPLNDLARQRGYHPARIEAVSEVVSSVVRRMQHVDIRVSADLPIDDVQKVRAIAEQVIREMYLHCIEQFCASLVDLCYPE